jgi:hypothetical protein
MPSAVACAVAVPRQLPPNHCPPHQCELCGRSANYAECAVYEDTLAGGDLGLVQDLHGRHADNRKGCCLIEEAPITIPPRMTMSASISLSYESVSRPAGGRSTFVHAKESLLLAAQVCASARGKAE